MLRGCFFIPVAFLSTFCLKEAFFSHSVLGLTTTSKILIVISGADIMNITSMA